MLALVPLFWSLLLIALAIDGAFRMSKVTHLLLCSNWERKIYARRPCVVLQRGIVGRVPWCKDYRKPLPYVVIGVQ